MKKNGRKHRRLQKEKLDRRKKHLEKCGAPYSKRKVEVCRHYGYNSELRYYKTRWGGLCSELIYTGAVSDLEPDTDGMCRCCGAEFPIESYYKMEHYVKNNCRIVNTFAMGYPSGLRSTQRIEETGKPLPNVPDIIMSQKIR